MPPMPRARALSLMFALSLAALCSSCSETAAPPPEPLPPGDGLPASVETMIFGSSMACLDDSVCPSGICTYGSCIGVLLADQRWMHARAVSRLRDEVERRAELRPRVLEQLGRVAQSQEADSAYRSRALRALEVLDAPDTLVLLLKDAEPRIAEESAIALARMGNPAGLEKTLALTRSENIPVSAEALRAVAHLPGDASLIGLLASLNPELDPPLVRAAIDGLAMLNDARAVRPLVSALPKLPGHLQHRVTDTLRGLTGARMGGDPAGWVLWVESHDPPRPPEVQMRRLQNHHEEGLPAPY